MTAITLWQPWASWICFGWKTIETRTHRMFAPLVGQRIAIHAGKRWDVAWYGKSAGMLDARQIDHTKYLKTNRPRGAVLCTVMVTDLRLLIEADTAAAMCYCRHRGLYGLILRNLEVLPEPVPCAGHQGMWNWTPPPEDHR